MVCTILCNDLYYVCSLIHMKTAILGTCMVKQSCCFVTWSNSLSAVLSTFTSAGVADPFTGTSVGLCGSVEHLTEMM